MRKHFTLESSTSVHIRTKSDQASGVKPLRKKRNDRNEISPSELVIRNILNYSLALSVLPTSEPGLNSMLMN